MEIKFDVFWPKNLGTLYKDSSIDILGREFSVDLDLKEVRAMFVEFKSDNKSFTDLVEIVDVEKGLVRVPFKDDATKYQGVTSFELVAIMKNGETKPSQTYAYSVARSLQNPNKVENDSNYPVLVDLIERVDDKISITNEAIDNVDSSIENMKNAVSAHIKSSSEAIRMDFDTYLENSNNDLGDKFNKYSNKTTSDINSVLDNKCNEVDERFLNKANEVDAKINSHTNTISEMNKEVESTTDRQEHLESTFNQLVINNGNSNAEIVDARVGENGKTYAKLGDRLDSVDSQLEQNTFYVTPEMFEEEGDIDDTYKIQRAIDYARDNNIEVRLKSNYITSKPITIYSKTHLIGATSNDEYVGKSSITNTTSNMFKLYNDEVVGYNLIGLLFIGSKNTICFSDVNAQHKWGVIEKCGFRNFNKVFNSQYLLGMKIKDIFINYCYSIGFTTGSDNTFMNWFVSSDVSGSIRERFLWQITSMKLSNFYNLYLTGSREKGKGCLNLIWLGNGSHGNTFVGCWFDYVDQTAVFLQKSGGKGCFGNKFIGCYFRGCQRVPNGSYNAIINQYGAKDNIFIANSFERVEDGITDDINKDAYVFAFNSQTLDDVKYLTENSVLAYNSYEIPFNYQISSNANNIEFNEPTINFKKRYVDGEFVTNKKIISNYNLSNLGTIKANSTKSVKINQSVVNIENNDFCQLVINSGRQTGLLYNLQNESGELHLYISNITSESIEANVLNISVAIIKFNSI